MKTFYYDSSSTGSTTFDWQTFSTGSAATFYFLVKTYLVDSPDHWTDEDTMGFVDLVNHNTRTGFMVEMVIKGEVVITDPRVERRSMRDFVPLLKLYASVTDKSKIVDFFNIHPLEPSSS